jgi:pyruvoyl-dependent arginine decarboxylase (PvlArgDC)
MQEALKKAGIQHFNIIEVSSVLDPGAVELQHFDTSKVPHASFAFCVFAHHSGTKGENIGAGVGTAWMQTRDGKGKAYVVEASGHKTEGEIKKEIMISLIDIAEAENLVLVPRPDSVKKEPLLGRKEWVKKMKEAGRVFEGFKTPEREYIKYLMESADDYFRIKTAGISGVPDDYGYAAAALVYVLETEQVTTKAHV